MPKTLQEILDHQDKLAEQVAAYDPRPEDERDPELFTAVMQAARVRAEAEAGVAQAVADAREGGYSWSTIGTALGVSGEAARKRYAERVP